MVDFASGIYTGTLRHRRFHPKAHAFEYTLFMMYLDTQEIESVFALSRWWSLTHFAPAQFKRKDFHIDAGNTTTKQLPSIDESVRNTVAATLGERPEGPIRMLINLRYWGISMNPISTYYCFDKTGKNVVAILAEVHNTPWNERHAYVLTGEGFAQKQQVNFSKAFHVSPFNPINMEYHWHSTTPTNSLALHLENWQDNKKIMDATMTLTRKEISQNSLDKIIIQFPLMTVKILLAIYWQALTLWWKGLPIFDHPKQ
jgi:DUF1365 family protein